VQAPLNTDEYNRGWNAVYSPTFDHYWEIAYKVEGCELPASTGTTTGPTTTITSTASTTTGPTTGTSSSSSYDHLGRRETQ
jgi:hypothetical protein